MKKVIFVFALLLATVSIAPQVFAQAEQSAKNKEMISQFDSLDGEWVGSAWMLTPDGKRIEITQTERVGSFLNGDIKMIEGRGYDPQGNLTFNALGIISYDKKDKAFNFRSYAMGHAGDFPMQRTDTGFVWELPAGPATIRYTAHIKDGQWHEIGERIVEGQPPFKFLEMNLQRVDDSDWPVTTPVTPNISAD